MSKEIAGHYVVSGCSFRAEAASEEELLHMVTEHAREAHGVTVAGPELLSQVRAAIKERP